ncbi:MAG: DUF5011 domain-containing protein [Candidatus Hydrogenedentes bacterium]|nr:DUF5011 domain-containing protein [Candidatus Hydrogenedentota bacterium]
MWTSSIAVDDSGGAYVGGQFRGTADFNPGAGSVSLSAAGTADAFLGRLNSSGALEWVVPFTGTSSCGIYSITLDDAGYIYTSGYFLGTVDFDPGPGTYNLTASSGHSVFFAKLDDNGNFVWAKNITGSPGLTSPFRLAVDDSGNVCATGAFNGTADFDPGPGTTNLTSAGETDIAILKLDSAGNLVWAKHAGGLYFDRGSSVAVDGTGNIYTTGYFEIQADLDPGAGTADLTAYSDYDTFVLKLDSAGEFVWVRQFGSTAESFGESINVASTGDIYVAGQFSGTTDFDPGPGTFYLGATGSDLYVTKLNNAGGFVWAQKLSISGSVTDDCTAASIDGEGNAYLAGYTRNTPDYSSVLVAKIDDAGTLVWMHTMGSMENINEAYAIAAHETGAAYAVGSFYDTIDFDPGSGTANLTAQGPRDGFIAKFSAGLDVVSVTRNDTSPTNSASVGYTVTFSDAVSGVDLTDLDLTTTGTLSGAAVTGISGSGAAYTVTVDTGIGAGTLRLDVVDDDSIIDGASEPLGGVGPGVGSFAGETYAVDHLAPNATLNSTAADPTNASPIAVDITFDESVSGFASGDVTVTNGTVTSFIGSGASYSIEVTPAAQGIITVQVGGAVCTDLVGNGNAASAPLSRTYDSVPPAAVLSSSATSPTNLSPIPVNLTFGEPVPGHRLPLGISVTNGTLANYIDAGVEFTFDVIPSGQGTVSVEVFDWVCLDAAGNFNEGDTLDIVFDSIPPAISVLGDNPVSAYLYAMYADAGATAFDANDGDLTADVIVDTSYVNTGVPGAYTVTYDVSDSAGNPAHATRTVQVDGLDPSVPMDWRWTLFVLSIAGIAALGRMKRQPK